ncbi:hypoxia-inducible factor prolyl hydroxylase-like [Oppia nitens]|uniref:hypoxia-inducible factor prolyl hydroxylase-like n=1 Tax=Oppia nitens TaxID=1686743 RepID=UPI0023DC3885|nr:hypoxia-inducible factor prolyl hydroxylase-like [Oppia nitens]
MDQSFATTTQPAPAPAPPSTTSMMIMDQLYNNYSDLQLDDQTLDQISQLLTPLPTTTISSSGQPLRAPLLPPQPPVAAASVAQLPDFRQPYSQCNTQHHNNITNNITVPFNDLSNCSGRNILTDQTYRLPQTNTNSIPNNNTDYYTNINCNTIGSNHHISSTSSSSSNNNNNNFIYNVYPTDNYYNNQNQNQNLLDNNNQNCIIDGNCFAQTNQSSLSSSSTSTSSPLPPLPPQSSSVINIISNNSENQQLIHQPPLVNHHRRQPLTTADHHDWNQLVDIIDVDKLRGRLVANCDEYCRKIIRDMNTVGVSVLDEFMGHELGELVVQEVLHLYHTVLFTDGKVVNDNNDNTGIVNEFHMREKIRGDTIYWVTGGEPNCRFISLLMQTLDRIIFKCNKMSNNGLMGINSISSRTSAMVACYPGRETSYKQHADNTICDGRYITCIYYVNKEWLSARDGGLLRLYPAQVSGQRPLSVTPEFDRLICFWSDRRNLHEVLPTNRMRFAITVWYFDDEERRRFRQKKKLQTTSSTATMSSRH